MLKDAGTPQLWRAQSWFCPTYDPGGLLSRAADKRPPAVFPIPTRKSAGRLWVV